MKFPSIASVAAELRAINANVEGYCDVRLQVYDDGQWAVRYGDSQYDTDHRGWWGYSSVPGDGRRFNSTDMARDLVNQCREHNAEAPDHS
jgi:hypothetical protein